MNKKLSSRKFILIAGLVCLVLSFATPTYAAVWYNANIVVVVPRAQENGDVFIQIVPAEGETRFSGRARVIIDGTAPGAGKLMTVCTAALLLNKRVTIFLNDPPSDTPQYILSVGLTQ